jgi:hypothetical protein
VAERFPDSKSTALARPGNSPRVSVRADKVLRNHKYSIFGISGEMRETPANQRDREFESISLRHRVLGLSILDDVREIRACAPLNAQRRYPNVLLLPDNQDFHRADRRTISERLGQAWCLQWKDMALNKRRSFVVR